MLHQSVIFRVASAPDFTVAFTLMLTVAFVMKDDITDAVASVTLGMRASKLLPSTNARVRIQRRPKRALGHFEFAQTAQSGQRACGRLIQAVLV